MKKFAWFPLLLLLCSLGVSAVELTPEEKQFLRQHPVIKAHNEQNWPPFNFHRNGEAQGYTIDLTRLLAQKLGIEVEFVSGPSWNEFLFMLRSREIDLITNMVQTPDRDEYTLFTAPVISELPVILSRRKAPIGDMASLKGKTVSVIKGFWHEEVIRRNHPEINVITSQNALESLKNVAFGRADATIGAGPVLEELIVEHSLPGIEISGEASFDGIESYFSRIGVRRDWPLLRSALDKALKAVTYQELQTLKNRWFRGLQKPDAVLRLSAAEKGFLREHRRIRVHNETDWPPFNFNENGEPLGLSIDFMDMLADKLGIEVEYVSGPTWNEFLNRLKSKDIDVMLNIVQTTSRDEFTLFTGPYITNPNVIVSRGDNRFDSIEQLHGRRVAVPEGFFYQELLDDRHPEVEQVATRGQLESLKAVLLGKADAALGELAVVKFLIDRNILNGLVLSGEVDMGKPDTVNLRIGTRNDWPELRSALDKAIRSVSPQEMRGLQHRWLTAEGPQPGNGVSLTDGERAYMAEKGVVRMCIDPNWMPFESFDPEGRHVGITADYYRLFEQFLPARFEAVPVKSWPESLELAQRRECDILSLAMQTPERSRYLDFTTPYLSIPLVIATKIDIPFIEDIAELEGRKVGIPRGYAFVEIIRNHYPGVLLEEVNDIDEGLERVRNGSLYAYLGTLVTIGNKIQNRYIGEIKITGKLAQKWELGIGVRNDDKRLLGILQKAVDAVSEEQRQRVLNKWVSVKYERGVDYSLVWRIAALAALAVLVIGYWNRKISRANNLLREARAEIEQKNRQLEKLATTDKLTGLFNRSKLDEVLGLEIDRSVRFGRTFGLCMIDIDHFKAVNDAFGHQEGDRVLVSFSQLLRAGTRKTDFVGRWGGEEFVVISPETDLEGMAMLAENLKSIIEHHRFGRVGRKTASFGITCSNSGDTAETIIQRADDALYEAKKTGRNRIVSRAAC